MSRPRRYGLPGALAAAAVALGLGAPKAFAEDITIGFVTHAQGNPFVEQIVDGAKAAAADLGVTLKVEESPGGSPEGQLKLAQGLVNAGASGRRLLDARRRHG